MTNKNKAKGDRAERAVRDWAVERYPTSFKTRAGFNEDMGDVIAMTPAGALVLQVKDVASPLWSRWFAQLRQQVTTATAQIRNHRVIGGVIVHKARGVSDPQRWRAVLPLEDLDALLQATYRAGVADSQTGS